MQESHKVSIIIPTLGRSSSFYDCLESLYAQTYQNFEIIPVLEEGPLAKLRNDGAKLATGDILTFIDDDVYCSKDWLQSIVEEFENDKIAGVSGPCFIHDRYKENRDLFRFKIFKKFYDYFFCEGKQNLPGHILKSGAWTTGACEENCSYSGSVDFLEACNMSFRRTVFEDCNGFDESFEGIGDWSEPDLSFRIRQKGLKLLFSKNVSLEHRPSRSGVYEKRNSQSKIRLKNYNLFSKRWIKPCFKHDLYKIFLKGYYAITSIK